MTSFVGKLAVIRFTLTLEADTVGYATFTAEIQNFCISLVLLFVQLRLELLEKFRQRSLLSIQMCLFFEISYEVLYKGYCSLSSLTLNQCY